jgi:hypothetical protein
MDSMRLARELRASLAGWGVVLGDVLETDPPNDALRWLLGCLASRLKHVAGVMRCCGLAALAVRADDMRYRAEHPEEWCAGLSQDEEDQGRTAARAARDLASELAVLSEEWARVYQALRQEDILKRARGPPVES